jgi:hypothetical protein
MIAAIALQHGRELVTGNMAHCRRIQPLSSPLALVDWRQTPVRWLAQERTLAFRLRFPPFARGEIEFIDVRDCDGLGTSADARV